MPGFIIACNSRFPRGGSNMRIFSSSPWKLPWKCVSAHALKCPLRRTGFKQSCAPVSLYGVTDTNQMSSFACAASRQLEQCASRRLSVHKEDLGLPASSCYQRQPNAEAPTKSITLSSAFGPEAIRKEATPFCKSFFAVNSLTDLLWAVQSTKPILPLFFSFLSTKEALSTCFLSK